MKKRYLSLFLAVAMSTAAISLAAPAVSALAAYDGTTIDSNLNATEKPDHITLTWSDDPCTTQTITWRTSTAASGGVAEYAELTGDTTDFKTVYATKEIFTTAATDNHKGTENIFSVKLTGLKSGTQYVYRVGVGTYWSGMRTFTTESANTSDFKFLVFGDSQSGNSVVPDYAPWHKTVENAFSANKDAKFMVNMGDLIENGQSYIHWNNWFDAAKDVIDKIPEMAVQGNHETYDSGDYSSTKPFYFVNQFKLPQNGPDGYKGQVYSYNYGNAHFAVLDSQEDEEAPGNDKFLQAQADWLDKDLSSSKAEWKFVFFHKTPYYNKATRTNEAIKKIFDPVIEKHHVDVVFNGHDHGVSRTYAINNGKYYTDFSKGTVYYVTGRSGAKYYPDLSTKIWDAFFYDPNEMPCYETVQINNGKLTINVFKQDGTTVDSLVIDKDNPENSTSMVLPPVFNVDTTIPQVASIGVDPRLVLFGVPIPFGSSQAEAINGKAYANPALLAVYMGGSYDTSSKTITVGKTTYTFTANDLSQKGNVSIDALNAKGFICEYNTQFNTVMVEK